MPVANNYKNLIFTTKNSALKNFIDYEMGLKYYLNKTWQECFKDVEYIVDMFQRYSFDETSPNTFFTDVYNFLLNENNWQKGFYEDGIVSDWHDSISDFIESYENYFRGQNKNDLIEIQNFKLLNINSEIAKTTFYIDNDLIPIRLTVTTDKQHKTPLCWEMTSA